MGGDYAGWAISNLIERSKECDAKVEGTAVSRLAERAAIAVKERGNAKMQGGEEGYEAARFSYSLGLLLCWPSSGERAAAGDNSLAITLLGNRAEVCLRLGRAEDAVLDATAACEGVEGGEKNERRLAR